MKQYKQDIINQGYKVEMVTWSTNNVTELKLNITQFYAQGLDGVILIGDLPYALGQYWESWTTPETPPPGPGRYVNFPCDLYLMDLDGNWTDVNGDNFYNVGKWEGSYEHNNGTADWFPEIWVARINPYSISMPGFNPITALSGFFNRTHELRTNPIGALSRPHNALLYIDDEWAAFESEWVSNFTAYTGANLACYANYSYFANDVTNSTYFFNNITRFDFSTYVDYELVHVMAHCNGTDQLFGIVNAVAQPNPLDGILNYTDIYYSSWAPRPLFYNLYSCFACNFDMTNNIGTHYLFDGSTINVIGCTRSGGMSLYQPFYDALKAGDVFGEAFKDWFYGPEVIPLGHWPEAYGMTILGDPLATIYMT